MDLPSADLMWSFFVAAVNSYRRDMVARPFPSDFIDKSGEKNFDNLKETIGRCPSLADVNQNSNKCDSGLMELIKWVLNPRSYTLRRMEMDKLKEMHFVILDNANPDFAFEVVHSQVNEDKFRCLKGTSKSIFAFHGSKLENFYSILNCGLISNLNKVSLYGEGIYLSNDLRIVLHYSPSGVGWSNSMFGSSLSCVALCEMIDHPDVKCNTKSLSGEDKPCNSQSYPQNSSRSRRAKIPGSEGGEIPEKYFVVRNDDLVRIKYLLLYCPQSNISRMSRISRNFVSRHKFLIVMLCYSMILIVASVASSNWFKS